jgi:outer membrane protein W
MKRQTLALGLAMGALLYANVALAQRPPGAANRGAIQVGLRLGYGLPLGNEGSAQGAMDSKLSDDIKGQIPLWIDAGYLFNPNFYLGLSFHYGFGLVNTDANPNCDAPGVSCSTNDVGFGLNLHYHASPAASFDPWVGLGIGYEWLGFDTSGGALSASGGVSGFEFVNLQVGGDFRVAPAFSVGPFLSFSAGRYDSASLTLGSSTVSQDIANKSFHEWLLFGVRAVYDIHL